MNFFRFRGAFEDGEGDMAKVRKPVDQQKVAAYTGLLVSAGTNRASFDEVLAGLEDDTDLSAAEIIAIATGYNRGGAKPGSKAKALATIKKRFVEIVRTDAKNKIAEKVRPW